MLKMLSNRVLIKPQPLPHLSEIIYSPDQTRTFFGLVVAVGPGKEVKGRLLPMGVDVGDKILYCNVQKFDTHMLDGEAHHIISEQDIGAVCDV